MSFGQSLRPALRVIRQFYPSYFPNARMPQIKSALLKFMAPFQALYEDFAPWPRWTVFAVFVILLRIYTSLFLSFMPNAKGQFAHDWSLGFPSILAGDYWAIENGLGSVPWFSPAKCGGYSYFANNTYYDLAQWLSFVVSPVEAVRLTTLIFATAGFAGFYYLMRRGFGTSRQAATLAGALFMFNGFYAYRSIMGHFFHGDMLLPWVVGLCLVRVRSTGMDFLIRMVLIGSCEAYMVHAGMLQILPAILMAMVGLMFLEALLFGWRWQPWLIFAGGGAVGLALAASKLIAMSSLLAQFPRTFYPLPGIPGLMQALILAFQTVFWGVPEDAPQSMVNGQWLVARHEWEFGVSPAPLLFIGWGLVVFTWRWIHNEAHPASSRGGVLAALGFAFILLLPVLLNWYSPGWNAFLKSLPYFDTASNLLRWFLIYIPLVIAVAGLLMDRLPGIGTAAGGWRLLLSGAGILVMLVSNLLTDRQFYREQAGYDVAPIQDAWQRAKETGQARPIESIIASSNIIGRSVNDAMIAGASPIACYEPTMGYRLEKFPVGNLKPGPVFSAEGTINIKNPACYLFPAENLCAPGDHFRLDQMEAARQFVAYKPYPFKLSDRQVWANRTTVGALMLSFIILLVRGLSVLRCWWRSRVEASP